ncbi:uncharacterized protein EI90DRAFT_2943471, partial [Cantharellus anzutake]|uniref:uncharacterized protein n=1 Tax=Cantharellus anzutake TaxID=1750568 RepID=UPI001906CBC5
KGCVILSILANSTNSRCNAFQAVQGFFLESVNTPERVINVLAHGGWSVSVMSMMNMVKSLTVERQKIIRDLSKDGLCALAYDNLDFDFKPKEATLENPGTFESITTGTFIPLGHSTTLDDLRFSDELWRKSSLNPQGTKDVTPSHLPSQKYILKRVGESIPHIELAMQWYIKSVIVEYLPSSYKDLLGPMPSSKWIGVEKSTQQPARAMHIKASSNDGNVEIVDNLERQLGTKSEWYDSYIRLCHGDLGTQERHDSTTFFHAIENSSQNRLQWLVTVPGVFHIRMAAVDAIWRTHISGHALQSNEGGTYKLFQTLRPRDFTKLSRNPSYHMLNDGIMHLVKVHITVCWEQVLGNSDLQGFSETEPAWDTIDDLAHQIFIKHFAGNNFNDLQDLPNSKCDRRLENQLLFNRDGLMYVLLAQASNTGAVGFMKDLLWIWVPMFCACGKHKYVAHLSKFLRDLHDTCPARLSHTIEMHWLCNPTGMPDGFRGVDW